jgi:GNAT superfamily N-acetyltransferase
LIVSATWQGPAGYEISTDPGRLELGFIHAFLTTSYWSPGIPRDVVERAIANSLPFGLYAPDRTQAGFARAVTDYATYAYIADLFVAEQHRGKGLGKFIVGSMLAHPELQGLRRWALATADAHGLYQQFGFAAASEPNVHMFRERAPEQLWP